MSPNAVPPVTKKENKIKGSELVLAPTPKFVNALIRNALIRLELETRSYKLLNPKLLN